MVPICLFGQSGSNSNVCMLSNQHMSVQCNPQLAWYVQAVSGKYGTDLLATAGNAEITSYVSWPLYFSQQYVRIILAVNSTSQVVLINGHVWSGPITHPTAATRCSGRPAKMCHSSWRCRKLPTACQQQPPTLMTKTAVRVIQVVSHSPLLICLCMLNLINTLIHLCRQTHHGSPDRVTTYKACITAICHYQIGHYLAGSGNVNSIHFLWTV